MKPFLALLLLFALNLFARGGEALRTARELCSLSTNGACENRPFDVTAQIIQKRSGVTGCAFTVRDATGGSFVVAENDPLSFGYRAGDVVRWTGATRINADRQMLAFCTNTTFVRHDSLPTPAVVQAIRIPSHDYDYSHVRLQGTISSAFRDEIDPGYVYLVLDSDGTTVHAALQDTTDAPCPPAERLIGAEIELTGVCTPHIGGRRIFLGPSIQLNDIRDVRILKAPTADPFDVPILDDLHHISASDVAKLGRLRVDGFITAIWRNRNFLIETTRGTILRAELDDGKLPVCGAHVSVVGTIETDLYHLNLTHAFWKTLDSAGRTNATPTVLAVRDLLFDRHGNRKFRPELQGRLFAVSGLVKSISSADDPNAHITILSDGNLLSIDTSSCPEVIGDLTPDCTVSVSGICVFDIENWRTDKTFPRINGVFLVVRRAADVTVLSHPPWWTPKRLRLVTLSLLAALAVFLVWTWILNRLVDRRSRQLLREQTARLGEKLKIDERTRLAVELHDALSQTLTGVAFQIDAAEQARQKDSSQIKRFLDVARQTLHSCREELKNCLWDLRNNALEEPDAALAIRKTVEPHIGGAELTADIRISRKTLTDNTFHSILCILRELSVNAARHGQARHIALTGQRTKDRLLFSVRDDGCGFDPDCHVGVDEGHFGLLGIAERIEDLDGSITIDSAPGKGTLVTFEIPT